ncbi:MAG: hypothetical protein IT437_14100 [Phycisphaerales bacterium]|nr:hypothetical protein [Phycisphaerales bacterium]
MSRRCGAAVLVLAAGTVYADDLTPPPWRFNPGTTVQHWDFSSGPIGFAPDAGPLNNPFGNPIMTPGAGANWLPVFGGRNDVWAIAGSSLNFDVPNTGNQANQKELWLQVTYFSAAPALNPNYVIGGASGPFTQFGSQVTPLGNGWFHELSKWKVAPCPPAERVSILPSTAGAQMLIDQVVIDTRCAVPAPGVAVLLAMAGLAAVRRRR